MIALAVPKDQTRAQSLVLSRLLLLSIGFLFAQVLSSAAQDRPVSFAELAERVSPAVVNITTTTTVAAQLNTGPAMPNGTPFDDFFRDFFDRQQQGDNSTPRPRQTQALGSGFVISEDGYLVTNNHVIEGADEIQIEFYSGLELPAVLIATDPATDIALLKVTYDLPLPFVPFGIADESRVGDWVLAVGNPLGQGFSVSAGIISARGRALQGNYDDYIQTDAAINRGNSGGPLFNMSGEVIGVNTAILSPNGGSIGIGFAMSSDVVSNVVAQLRDFGETRRGWLGVRIQDVTADVAEALSLTEARGALVTEVMPGPSLAGGVLTGDVITEFDGGIVGDTRDLVRRVGEAGVGRAVDVVVFREGAEVTLSVVLGQRELAEAAASVPVVAPAPVPSEFMGLTIATLTDEVRQQMNLAPGTEGVLVTAVDPNSEAASKGILAGDVITEAGQQAVRGTEDLVLRSEEAVQAGRRSLLLLLRRDGDPRFVALSVVN
jgi:serine protease Do